METDSHIPVMPWPLAREVGQNTRVLYILYSESLAQTFTASDGAERTQSCFISLVFLASLKRKRERKGCFHHREQRWVMEILPCVSWSIHVRGAKGASNTEMEISLFVALIEVSSK